MTAARTGEPTVLFATDLEGDVEQGLRVASQLAAERAATLVVVHVIPVRQRDGEGMLQSWADAGSGRFGVDLEALTPGDDTIPFLTVLLIGEPEDELVRIARERDVALVVMEARPRGLLERCFGPGLTERVGAEVGCPVVTYHPRRDHRATAPTRRAGSALSPLLSLQVVLDARVDAVLDWMDGCVHAAAAIARRASIQDGIASVLAARSGGPFERHVADELSLELREHLWATQASGVEVWLDPVSRLTRRVPELAGSPNRVFALGDGAHPGPERDAWLTDVLRDGAAVSLPMESRVGRSGVVLAGARLPLTGGRVAVLVLAFDARRGFLRILAQPGPTPSAETYAFDARGLMLSNSRFPEQLRRAGLLSAAAQTPGRLRVCDPGRSLLSAPPPEPSSAWPLTQMAADAITGHDGSDTRGYRDYRGVPVIGAWRWIPEHGFGVAAEMDVAEASG